MAQHGFNQFAGSGRDGNSIDPNDLSMNGGAYSPSFSHMNTPNNVNPSHGFSSGTAGFGDDELLDGLGSPSDNQPAMSGHGQDFNGMSDMNMAFSHGTYGSHRANPTLQLDSTQGLNGYSNTPDGEPLQSPYVHSYGNNAFRQVHPNQMGTSLQSPISYSGSPHGNSDINQGDGFLDAKGGRVGQVMQRKPSHTRSPMTPKTVHGLSLGSQESPGFGPQPIQTQNLSKSPNSQWLQTPAGSMAASYGSGFSSPLQPNLMQINEVMMKGGTSMPAKLTNPVSSQEMKRKRRRESHNLVERRRRDNINERIQDLSRLVPMHRLEDEKIRKMIQNGTPLSPTLTGMSRPNQATSGLAGPGARRAAGAGNITTGLPIEEKDKGPNKGDILNGAVSWTRDLMWMLQLKLQQHEELMNTITEMGGQVPFEMTEDERRMQSELAEAFTKNSDLVNYSRTAGSGLRVPNHTDYRGDPLDGAAGGGDMAISPAAGGAGLGGDIDETPEFWNDPDDDPNGHLRFKEEDEFDLDMTH